MAGSAPGLLASCGGGSGKLGGQIRVSVTGTQVGLQPLLKKFKEQTGITAQLEQTPSAGGEQVQQLSPQFAASTSPFDVITMSDEATPPFLRADWLEPLDEVVGDNFWDDFTDTVMNYQSTWSEQSGTAYRIPATWSTGYNWVRQDILEELGAQAPASWDELLELGRKARPKGMYAFADAASVPSLAFVYAAYLTAQAGGDIFAFDDGTRQAFEFAKEMVDEEVYPRSALNWTYDQLNGAYLDDKLLTMREWDFFYDVSRADKKWWEPEKTVVSLPPQGPARAATWAGGWGWTIPKFTENMDQAKAFVRFMTAPENAVEIARANSAWTVPRKSILDALGGEGIVKYLTEYVENNAVATRPFHPRVNEAQTAVDEAFNGYLTGQLSLDEAFTSGKNKIETLKT
jgi:multiple sugar transport system substrate-binding protein